jgi:hypothetical protein
MTHKVACGNGSCGCAGWSHSAASGSAEPLGAGFGACCCPRGGRGLASEPFCSCRFGSAACPSRVLHLRRDAATSSADFYSHSQAIAGPVLDCPRPIDGWRRLSGEYAGGLCRRRRQRRGRRETAACLGGQSFTGGTKVLLASSAAIRSVSSSPATGSWPPTPRPARPRPS